MNPVPFDFRKPARVPAEWHRQLMSWFHAACAAAGRAWAKQLPVGIELAARFVEDGYAKEMLTLLPAESLGQRIMIGAGRVPSLLVMSRPLALNLIGAMLGERGPQEDRELTMVEEELADYFLVSHWFPAFRDTWPDPTKLAWQLLEREGQPSHSKLFAPTDVLVRLHWQVSGPFGDAQGHWFFPRQALMQALAKEPETAPVVVDEKQIAARRAQIVRSLPLSIECILGTTQLRLSDLSRLQVGDVLLLDGGAAEGVTVSVGGRQLFRGQAGRTGSFKAFRIDSVIEK